MRGWAVSGACAAAFPAFAVADPPLRLVLIAGDGTPGTLNHLVVEVATTDDMVGAISRLQAEGLATDVEEQTTCCYAVQDKVWVHGPDAEPWEVYTVLADAPVVRTDDTACCAPEAETTTVTIGAKAACC